MRYDIIISKPMRHRTYFGSVFIAPLPYYTVLLRATVLLFLAPHLAPLLAVVRALNDVVIRDRKNMTGEIRI